ncbi:hypothetical protein H6P81_013930 [Aristolochia fimbriata]|uniref:Uncharacterized protein n=1 Tax=Aristolochia fimbriata TaxID=158543 RepID=A0AAV7EG49_ARIFI|nr:hypothetical protein H6P81_013930 [Aristolochia fimbriata]
MEPNANRSFPLSETMVSFIFQLVFLSSALVALSEMQPIPFEGSPSVRRRDPPKNVVSRVEEVKSKISQLESILEEYARQSNPKDENLKDLEKQNAELTNKILVLEGSLEDIKQIEGDLLSSSGTISQLKEEVQLLWATSRKNNFDLQVLEAETHNAEDKLKKLASKAVQEANIINEQWIQIQHLEQALQMSKIRVSKAHREVYYAKCTLLKSIKEFCDLHLYKLIDFLDSNLPGKEYISPYLLHSSSRLRSMMSAAEKYHHELQRFVKRLMEKSEITSAFANEELIFFMVSVLITFPFMTVWHFLISTN